LLVEDNPDVQSLTVKMLRVDQHVVTVANHGLAALEVIRDAGPVFDVALVDIDMPVMDGMTLAAELTEMERERGWTHLPRIAFRFDPDLFFTILVCHAHPT
jgi:CheY-like chemotaxis protein